MLRAGYAAVEITPGRDLDLLGYEFRQEQLPSGNDGVHDPLLARVLVLHDGQQPAAIVSLELAVVEVELARRLRQAVAAKLGTSAQRILLATTHTHSGPFPRLPQPASGRGMAAGHDAESLGVEARRQDYARLLEARLLDAAARAAGLIYPVNLTVQSAPLGIGYVRRMQTPEGVRHCWNPLEFPELHPDVSPDPACTVITLRQPRGPRSYVLWSAGAHPVVLGKTSRVISADWPGAACRLIEQGLPGARSLFLLGACGEVHPWIATQEDPAQIQPVAAAAAGMVRLLSASGAGLADDQPALRIVTRTWTCGKHELDLAVWRVGPAWVFAAPVELFASLSARLRARHQGPAIVATVTNGWTGYWPDESAFAGGSYEVNASWGRQPGDGERLIEQLLAMAEEAA